MELKIQKTTRILAPNSLINLATQFTFTMEVERGAHGLKGEGTRERCEHKVGWRTSTWARVGSDAWSVELWMVELDGKWVHS